MIHTFLAGIGLVVVLFWLVLLLSLLAFVVRDRVRFVWRYFKARRRMAHAIDTVTFDSHRYDAWAKSHAAGKQGRRR